MVDAKAVMKVVVKEAWSVDCLADVMDALLVVA